jgi:Holliday junction resolvase RusA-like endonuclease
MKTIIPGRLESLNQYISAMNRNRFVGNKMKKESMQLVGWYLKQLKPVGQPPYTVHIDYYEQNKKRDLDNISAFARKVLLDSLQEVGVISNDGWKDISGFVEIFYVDKNNPRIVLELLGNN